MTSPEIPGSASPPSLFASGGPKAASVAPSTQPDELRMLSGLDTRRSKLSGALVKPGRKTLALLAGGLLVTGAAVGWWQWELMSAPADISALAAASTSAALPAAIPDLAASAPAVVPALAASATVVASAPAAIETLMPPVAATPQEAAVPRSVAVASPPARTAAPDARPARSLASAAVQRSNPASHPVPGAHLAARPAALPPRVPAGTPGGDSDVDLLAAMVTRLERERRPTTTARSSKPKAVHQPVIRTSTLEKLARSCKQFGRAEEAQCRRQVCEGNRGRVAACPASLAPKKGSAARG